MDMFLINTNNNNIVEPITIKRTRKTRHTKNIKTKIPNNINNDKIITQTKDIIICNL